jgi:hypothetical protein
MPPDYLTRLLPKLKTRIERPLFELNFDAG